MSNKRSELTITDIGPLEGAAIMAEVRAAHPNVTIAFGPAEARSTADLDVGRVRAVLAKIDQMRRMSYDEWAEHFVREYESGRDTE